KASLFMAAGIIDHETGTRDLRKLSGLYRSMPHTATLALVAAAAMAGVPLLNGLLSKEMFLAEALEGRGGSVLDTFLPVLATAALALRVLYSVRFTHQTFFGPDAQALPRRPKEAPFWMRVPAGVLVLGCLVIGIFPASTIGPFLDLAARSVLGELTPSYSLSIWHGFTTPLVLSLLALLLGGLGYRLFKDRLNAAPGPPVIRYLKGRRGFELSLAGIILAARWLERLVGTRRLQTQFRLLVALAALAALLPFLRYGFEPGALQRTPLNLGFAALWIVGAACAVAAAWLGKYHRLAALILISGAGLVSCITFVWLSAPDLALTQLLVEIVTTVLLLLCLRWLPQRSPEVWPGKRPPASVLLRRGTDLVLALLV